MRRQPKHYPQAAARSLMLAGAIVLAGCTANLDTHANAPPATTPIHGTGFTLAPPAGAGWVVLSTQPSRIVFAQRAGDAHARTAGADAIADVALAASLQADDTAAARDWLARRLLAPRRDSLGLAIRPAQLAGARCLAYDAAQVDHVDPAYVLPDQVEARSQYVQHGLLCAHPHLAGLSVQVFDNDWFPRDAAAPPGDEAARRAFFGGLRWEGPR